MLRRPAKVITPLDEAFNAFRPALVATAAFSVVCSLLLFVGPLYMLQVYDRVLASRSESTLIALTLIAVFLLVAYSLFDMIRSRILVRAGARFDAQLNAPLFRSVLDAHLANRAQGAGQALRDIDTVREFWTGPTVITLCDAPFAPIFVLVCFLFHPLLGLVAAVGAILLFLLAVLNEITTRDSLKEAGKAGIESSTYAQSALRNIEVIQALGMHSALHRQWSERHAVALGWQALASDRAGVIGASTKFVRSVLQVAILGVGAWLAIIGSISPGVMIAASIMMGRALQPVEQAVAQWKSLIGMRNAWERLQGVLQAAPAPRDRLSLPQPQGAISVDRLVVTPPGRSEMILKGVSFEIAPGMCLAVTGPSAAGKSTLARALVGVWPAAAGTIRLDGSELRHYDREQLGRSMGYLPQDVELFPGTVRENIARCEQASDDEIIAAAKLAGVHEMIAALPESYETQIGEGGMVLSGGQRQRVGLARAVFRRPSILVLDEPNAHLDSVGEEELLKALQRIKRLKTTIIFIAHRKGLLAVADKMLMLNAGKVLAFGTGKEVVAALQKHSEEQAKAAASAGPQLPVGPRIVADAGKAAAEPIRVEGQVARA